VAAAGQLVEDARQARRVDLGGDDVNACRVESAGDQREKGPGFLGGVRPHLEHVRFEGIAAIGDEAVEHRRAQELAGADAHDHVLPEAGGERRVVADGDETPAGEDSGAPGDGLENLGVAGGRRTTVIPLAGSAAMTAASSRLAAGSRPARGSSRRRSRGS